MAIESCKAGEHLRCPGAATGEAWTRIARLEVRDADTFIRLHFSNEESLDVTPHHIFTLGGWFADARGAIVLVRYFGGDGLGVSRLRKIEAVVEDSQKVTVSCEPTHQFYAGRHAAGILTHNYTFSS